MGDDLSFTPTPVKQAVVSHAPLVRARMVVCHARRQAHPSFSVGDIVSVVLPREERSSGDFSCYFGRLLSNPHGHFYEVKCESGRLQSLFSAG